MPRWAFSSHITAVLDSPDVPDCSWELHGSVKAWASADTGWLDFDDLCHSGLATSRKVRITRHAPFERLEAEVDPRHATVSVLSDARAEWFDVVLTPNPKLPVGPFSFEVAMEAVEADGRRHPVSPLVVRGEMQTAVRVTPRLVLLGEHQVGELAEGEIEVTPPPEGEWVVKQVECESSDVRVEVLPPSASKTFRFAARQRVAAVGDFRTSIQFVLAGPNGETVRAKTEVVSFGVPRPK